MGPSTNSQPIKNTKITRNTLGVHGSVGGKRQSAFNYYERINEKTSDNLESRKTAVERAKEISHKLEDKRQAAWSEWIQKMMSCEAIVEKSSCGLCAIICALIFLAVCI